MPDLCLKCNECAWENLMFNIEPCKSCFEDNNFEPKTTQVSQQLRTDEE